MILRQPHIIKCQIEGRKLILHFSKYSSTRIRMVESWHIAVLQLLINCVTIFATAAWKLWIKNYIMGVVYSKLTCLTFSVNLAQTPSPQQDLRHLKDRAVHDVVLLYMLPNRWSARTGYVLCCLLMFYVLFANHELPSLKVDTADTWIH
jgi:hypothetical protein